jgi:hypothetical protein
VCVSVSCVDPSTISVPDSLPTAAQAAHKSIAGAWEGSKRLSIL